MVKVGIVGATGYAGEELVRVLSAHPKARIAFLSAVVDREEPISKIFPSFKGRIDMVCRKPNPDGEAGLADLVFLALPHKVSMEMAPRFLSAGKKVIDLSADYRLAPDVYKVWYGVEHKDRKNLDRAVYGLPELYAPQIKGADLIANPGCYPTSVILALAPALEGGIAETARIIVDSKSGATGAGRKADAGLCFAEVNENLKAYRVAEHQHKPEMDRILSRVAGQAIDLIFVPHLVPLNRGILSTIYIRLKKKMSGAQLVGAYRDFYKGKPFVRVMDDGEVPQIKNVVMTNYCDIGIKVRGDDAIVISCIDNLLKGAAGQAVQNMNLMCGFDEKDGLA